MTGKILPIMGMMLILAGCQSASDEVIIEQPYIAGECADGGCAVVRYATPNGNDLVLETDRHVIQIQAQPNVPYTYQVWTGGKTPDMEPDMVVTDGDAMILVSE
ncbi:MAG: hypothetical protein E7011_05160 [Alphaproteobacteria bacterium]|nr:hypothetical protein [Alphaproteobacteria bacterium]